MLFLGFNEFMALIYSPIMALALILLILFCRSLYIEMDVDNEMQKGALPGAISLAGKFVPSVKSISNKSLESVMQLIKQEEETAPTRTADGTSGTASSSAQHEGLRQRTPPPESLSSMFIVSSSMLVQDAGTAEEAQQQEGPSASAPVESAKDK